MEIIPGLILPLWSINSNYFSGVRPAYSDNYQSVFKLQLSKKL